MDGGLFTFNYRNRGKLPATISKVIHLVKKGTGITEEELRSSKNIKNEYIDIVPD